MLKYRLCCLVGLLTANALALPGGPDEGTVSASGRRDPATYSVEVTFVGEVGNDAALGLVIGELLDAHGARSEQRHVARLLESDLLDSTDHNALRSVRIWITLPSAAVARLWFAAPTLDRYLWRELALPRGLDAIAHEQLAQIVQSSADALSKGDEGLTRTDAQRALQRQQAEALAQEHESAPERQRLTSRVTVRSGQVTVLERKRGEGLQPTASAGYGFAYATGELGPLHGPLLEIGLENAKGRRALGIHLAYEWHLAQSFTRDPAQLTLQSQMGWLLLVWRSAVTPPLGLTSSVGFGTEATTVRPKSTLPSSFLASREYTDWAYLVRLRLGLTGSLGGIGWTVNAYTDLSLSETSYGITTAEHGYKSLVELWHVRPGLQLGFVFK